MNINWLLGVGTGCLGLKVAEFFEMRPAHFFLMLFEYNREQEQKYRMSAELVRLQTATLVNVQVKRENQLKPVDLWKFPWDGENDAVEAMKKMSREEVEERLREFLKKKKESEQ